MTNFYYDPIRNGYTTASFVTTAGTPAVSTTFLRFNAAAAIHVGNLYKGNITISAKIPAAPTAGDSRFIGLSNLGLGCKIGFDITGAVLSAVVQDINGNTTSQALSYVSTWTNAATLYEIIWIGQEVFFVVNGVQLWKTGDISVPRSALSVYIKNSNSDNMDIVGINFKDVETYM